MPAGLGERRPASPPRSRQAFDTGKPLELEFEPSLGFIVQMRQTSQQAVLLRLARRLSAYVK
jgi:hypothetical protein